jgi:hypothetical protein
VITLVLVLVAAAGAAFFLWSPTWLAPKQYYAQPPDRRDTGDGA